jgi:glycine hydroxymethyltransferase
MDSHRAALRSIDPAVFQLLCGEEQRQSQGIELIPSENYTHPAVLAALGSVFTNKYSEGYPGRRYYGGQEFTDPLEELARERARALFRCEHANVQPLSGSAMNQAAYLAFLEPGETVLAMDLSHGGHLTHGAPVSHMGRLFRFVRYKTQPDAQGRIDFDELRQLARRTRPRLVLCGTTSYPRRDDYASFRAVADEVGALAMADISHVGGLVAAGVLENPFDHGFDVVTTTTHKSLRGPRGGLILCRREHARAIDASVFPGLQGGPHMNAVAALAITLELAGRSDFERYARQVLTNARALAQTLMGRGAVLVTGGTHHPQRGSRRTHRGAGPGRRRDHDQQADHAGRPEPTAATERATPRHARRHHPRHARAGDAPARRLDHERARGGRAARTPAPVAGRGPGTLHPVPGARNRRAGSRRNPDAGGCLTTTRTSNAF